MERVHNYYCTRCGKMGFSVKRMNDIDNEQGKLINLFCKYCQKDINHVEIAEGDRYSQQMFVDEFMSGNFDKNGERVIPLKDWSLLYYGSKFLQDADEMENAVNGWTGKLIGTDKLVGSGKLIGVSA
ncbi:MAG: hypothetical protein K6E10_08375 [Eubacterium sp.]|nr:hypothetical protein [Eubacterium sp.]